MKRLTRTIAAAALASALVLAAGCSGGSDDDAGDEGSATPDRVTYLTSSGNFGRDSYAWVAKDKKFFEEAGIEVEIKPGWGTDANIQTIVGGQAQFTPIDLTGGLLRMGSGQAKDFVAVAGIQQRTMAAILALDGNGINTPTDLEGKTLADTPGSVVRDLFPTYARLAGVDETRVTWVNGEAPTLMGTLASGAVDGIGQYVVGKPTVETVAKGRKAVTLPYSDVMTDLYGNVLITSTKLAQENPDLVRRFSAALIKGLVYSIENPREAGEILSRNVDTAIPAAAAAELELMAAFVGSVNSGEAVGTLDSHRVARSIAILQGGGAIPAGLTPEQIVDFDLVPRA